MAFTKKLFFAIIFFSILMEGGSSSSDPWSQFGWYFHADLQSWLPPTHIPFNPFEITIIIIVIAWALRGRRDRRFHFERGLLFWPVVVFGALLFVSLLWGESQSGSNFTIGFEEARGLLYALIAYFLVGLLFTQRRDLDTLTWIILISAMLLGFECIIRYEFFLPGHNVGDLDYDHSDATMLAAAMVLSIAMLLLGSTRRQRLFVFISLPIDLLALMVTHRRAGEAALVLGLVLLAIILFRVNRSLFLRIVPVTALIFSIYVGVNWNCNSGSALCQPARAISSQFTPDPRDASSDAYRQTEQYDLIVNIQNNPILGRGFGQQFIFYQPLPDLSFWAFWHYTPHDEILWVWVKMGIFGFMAFWWLIASALYRSGRLTQALSAAGDYNARALLAAAACLIAMQMTISYVDLGLTDDRPMLLFGVMLGVIGHLPGILRRSTGINAPTSSTRSGHNKASGTPTYETPEIEAKVLAQALTQSAEAAGSARSKPANLRQNPSRAWEARWGQGVNTSAPTSQPGSSTSQPRPLRQLMKERAATYASSDTFDDELPWSRNSGKFHGE